MQEGGLFLNREVGTYAEENFRKYFFNSQFQYLAKGSFGLLVKSRINPTLEYSFEPDELYRKAVPNESFGSEVSNLLHKFVLIDDEEKLIKNSIRLFIEPTKSAEFTEEINKQTEIYSKTIKYLQPLCPAVVFARVIKDRDEIKDYLYAVYRNNHSPKSEKNEKDLTKYMSILFEVLTDPDMSSVNLGIFSMELLNNVCQIYSSPQFLKTGMAMNYFVAEYALMELAVQTGYVHNDYHTSNIMLCESNDYFSETALRPMLLDFGMSKQIDSRELFEIRNLYAERNFYDCLISVRKEGDVQLKMYKLQDLQKAFPNKKFKNQADEEPQKGKENTENNAIIQQTNGTVKQIYNEILGSLVDQRRIAIERNKAKMERLHLENDRYPLIPLSDESSFRNKFFRGLYGGALKKRKRRKKSKFHKYTKKSTKKSKKRKFTMKNFFM